MKMNWNAFRSLSMTKAAALALSATAVTAMFSACGGGGGDGANTIYYPYKTVYGDICQTTEPTPGCTFNRSTGTRITVEADPHYNDYGNGAQDMWYVKFDGAGTASVYNERGQFQYYADISEFDGYIPGTGNTIGVGTGGTYWENVLGGTYWLGKNGVLYSANYGESRYGQAINNQNAGRASDTNFAALKTEANKKLVEKATQKLVKEYGFKTEKARAVASALNSWAVAAAERGKTTNADLDRTFKAVFGVNFSDSLAAVKDLQKGDVAGMQDLTNRSAAALGLKPNQAQKFIKGMYKQALADWGYDANSINW